MYIAIVVTTTNENAIGRNATKTEVDEFKATPAVTIAPTAATSIAGKATQEIVASPTSDPA
jgi:hypothetical protein